MKNTGDYTGTPDDVLDRYEYLSGLQDTTRYSQKEWEIIYKHSGVVMEVLLAHHRGELPKYWELTPEKRLNKDKVVNLYREPSRTERIKKREKLLAIKKAKEVGLGALVDTIGKISKWRAEVDERKGQVISIMNRTKGGADELRNMYKNCDNDYSSQSTENIIMWIVHYTGVIKGLPQKAGKYKNLCKEIIKELHIELKRRGDSIDIFEVNRRFIDIPQARKDTFFNALNITTGAISKKTHSIRR